jgi:hypothetical protein
MTYKPHPFRATKLRRHYFPTLYFDADHVKPLNGKSILFRPADTQRWKWATKGARALRHPRPAHHSDPITMMCLIEMLMRIDVHSEFTAGDLVPLLDEDYKDFMWSPGQVGIMLGTLYRNQEKSGAPTWGQYGALWRHKGVRPRQGTLTYCLYPERETYLWLAKLLQRLIDFNYQVIRKERKLHARVNYNNKFPEQVLWDPEWKGDTRHLPITAGIVFKQI